MGMSLKGTGLNPPPRKATKQGNWSNKTKWRRSWRWAWRGGLECVCAACSWWGWGVCMSFLAPPVWIFRLTD